MKSTSEAFASTFHDNYLNTSRMKSTSKAFASTFHDKLLEYFSHEKYFRSFRFNFSW